MDNDTSLHRMLAALEVWRTATDGYDLETQDLITFLYVATHDGCLQQVLEKVTGKSVASVSRTLDRLGLGKSPDKAGFKLVRREKDSEDYKRRRVYLTMKGERLASLLQSQLEA